MLKTTTIAACVLALSGSAALAQSSWMPPGGANDAAGGANGAARVRDIGTAAPSVDQTAGGRTTSTTILSQSNKQQSAAGAARSDYSSQAQMQYGAQNAQAMGQAGGSQGAYITDEYGNRYDSRGNRIGRGQPVR